MAPAAPPRGAAGNFGMEFVRTLWLGLALALALGPGPGPAGGHPQPCGVLERLGGSVRLGALLPRAPAARARVRAALARAARAPRLPHNLSLELVAAAPPARDPASLARGLCQALAAPGVRAVLAFPGARPELRQLHFLAAAAETPVLSVLRREARAPLGDPVRGDARGPDEGGPGTPWGAGAGGPTPEAPGGAGTGAPGARGTWTPDPGCPLGRGDPETAADPVRCFWTQDGQSHSRPAWRGAVGRGGARWGAAGPQLLRRPPSWALVMGSPHRGCCPCGPQKPSPVRGRPPAPPSRAPGWEGKRVFLPVSGVQFRGLLVSPASSPRRATLPVSQTPPSASLEFILSLIPPLGLDLGPKKQKAGYG